MRLWIDADACPVVNLAIRVAQRHEIEITLVCDDAHYMQREGAKTITVSQGADSADLVLVNRLESGDAVVTQDYGLAAMCLSRGAVPIHQDGMIYTNENIDGLLFFRAAARRIRSGGGRLKGPPKRTKAQDQAFEATLRGLLEGTK